ncbi:MAG: hypothetical protein COX70_08265 [Flavobacteriales bacterium CG_4_10_14_0_2_um_filter_32_8]|nr:MAG: hypothetical protein COX70_08265 [Flavobacteriales bacterium CG_4_10_14_0_2_um_filter_32_8]PJB14141.1 MAG: hypothetical protein CO118_10170 [Flavobacteriales bacterium CG_4_9_14_3_um_filter_32_8]
MKKRNTKRNSLKGFMFSDKFLFFEYNKTSFIPKPNGFSENEYTLVSSITQTKHLFFRKAAKFEYIYV